MKYTDEEEFAIAELMALTELTREQVLRQALRYYQLSFIERKFNLSKLCTKSYFPSLE